MISDAPLAPPRRDQFDGLRCFLFICVFTVHSDPRFEFLGYALPVFFVMSGFLVTRLVMDRQHEPLPTRLRIFYLNRAIRIFPAYYAVLVLILLFDDILHPESYLFYYVNVKLFLLSLSPGSPALDEWFGNWKQQDLHLWSLSVEEQFYILFPLLFYWIAKKYKWLLFLGILAFSIASRLWLMHYYPESFYGLLLNSCAEYFVWGCFFAYYDRIEVFTRNPPYSLTVLLPAAIIIGLIFVEFYFGLQGFYMNRTTHFQTPIAALLGVFIWGLWHAPPNIWLIRLLSFKPFVYLGVISYPMYLTHMSTLQLTEGTIAPIINSMVSGKHIQFISLYVFNFAVTAAISACIWHFIEQPAARLRRYISRTVPESA